MRYTRIPQAAHEPARLSPAALQVIAVVAYKGPCSKQVIDGIQGVDSGSCLKQLLKHQLIDIRSSSHDVPHHREISRGLRTYLPVGSAGYRPVRGDLRTPLTRAGDARPQELWAHSLMSPPSLSRA
ncbi:MAG: SMC-Scp complex subunit ScpB [Anaerotruncus sp.]|nr:SMC-Scp complex subunit ScpB [Anaerotruncus sp.]